MLGFRLMVNFSGGPMGMTRQLGDTASKRSCEYCYLSSNGTVQCQNFTDTPPTTKNNLICTIFFPVPQSSTLECKPQTPQCHIAKPVLSQTP